MAVLRFVTSPNNAVETAALTVESDSMDADAWVEREFIWLFRTVVSVPSTVFCARMDVLMDVAAFCMDADTDDTAPLRTNVSVISMDDPLEFAEVNDDMVPVIELESEEMELLRAPTSVANAMENCVLVS